MAQKILVKRGLQAAVDDLVLSVGEFAVATDTGNVYIGITAGKEWLNPPAGTAETAKSLSAAREFSITGDVTSAIVSFDGTQNVTLQAVLATISGLTSGTYTKVTVNEKGLVVGASTIEVADLPTIPSTKISGLGSAATKDTGTSNGNVVVVGSDGKISASVLPNLAIMDIYEASSEAAMLALNCQKGDICIRSDLPATFILTADGASTLANWKQLATPDCKVQSVNGKTGVIVLTPSDIGAETLLKNATAKASIVDNDNVAIVDSADSSKTKIVKWSVLKSTLKTYFDTLYNKYVHPTYTAKTSGLYKVTVDGTGHISAATAVVKSDITGLGIPAQDTTYTLPTATASVLGGVKVGDGLTIDNSVLSVGTIDGGTF